MSRTIPAAALLVIGLLLATPSQAMHCNGNVVTIDAGIKTYYVDDRGTASGQYALWIYEETNGHEGLQSGAGCAIHSCEPPIGYGDTCYHENPDLLVT